MPRQTVTRRRSADLEESREETAVADSEQDAGKGTRRARNQTRSSRVAEQAKASAGMGGGWGNYSKVKEQAKSRSFNNDDQLKVEDDPILLKFLQEAPFDTYFQHWVQRGKGKKRSWTCPGEDECPLCALDHPVRFLALFNVVLIDGEKHTLKYWVAGKNASDQIEEFANSKRHSPINDTDLYFEVVRKEADFGYKYTLNPLRESELEAEEVVSGTEEAGFLGRLFESDKSTVESVNWEGLEECAEEIVKKGDR